MGQYVLIAEDDVHLRLLVQEAFEHAGFNVLTAEDGTRALEILEERIPDVLVLDMKMPGASGLKIMRKVRQSSGGQKASILLMTGDEAAMQSPEAALADFVMRKPVSMSQLVLIARRMIDTTTRTESNGQDIRELIKARMKAG